MDINVIAENLAELLTNTVNMTSIYYDIFLNPTPMDVELEMYNDENELITVTIPNRAKDKQVAYSGSGSPEGRVIAPVGSAYVDTTNSTVYYKMSGNDEYGWDAVLSQTIMELYIRTYLESRGYITLNGVNQYLTDYGYIQSTDIASVSDTGVVKIDGTSTNLNESSQLVVKGIYDDNNSGNVKKVWTGTDSEYMTLINGSGVSPNTIYFVTDTGRIFVGNTEIAGAWAPSDNYDELTVGIDGAEYEAPANGWVNFMCEAGTLLKLYNVTMSSFLVTANADTDSELGVCLPVRRGDIFKINYIYTTGGWLRFHYAVADRIEPVAQL